MLVGNITYKHEDKAYRYTVEGIDTAERLSLFITSGNYDAIMLMSNDMGIDDGHAQWERFFEVGISKVYVSTENYTGDVNGRVKKIKATVNADLFCRLASLIRYAKTHCSTRNEVGFLGLSLASGEFEVLTERTYKIKFPLDNDRVLADVTLNYGSIVSLDLNTDDVSVHLEQDTGVEPRLIIKPKDCWSSGIRLTEEYLGFPLKKQVIPPMSSSDGLFHSLQEIMLYHPEKELEWLLDKDYHIVTDDNLEKVCSYIYNHDGYVYYDTETTGLNINFYSRLGQADVCVGVILSVKFGESFFFPLQMKYITNLCNGDHHYVMEHYLKPILEGKDLVAHNMTFDWKVGYIYDINCNIVHDTLALLKLTLGAEMLDFRVGLKDCAKLFINRDSLELSDLVVDDSWGESDIKFWDLPAELVKLYACADTDNTQGLLMYSLQEDLLGKYGANKVYEIEIAFSYAVAYQEFYGHRLNVDRLEELKETLYDGQAEEMKAMEEIVGHSFNPNSPKQLVQIIYNELGYPIQTKRGSDKPTTDKDALKRLAGYTDLEGNVKYPFVKHLLTFREYEGVRKVIDKAPEHMTSDGYIFSDVQQYGTTTGRVSIKNPNYQSYNDPVKREVIPRPGYYMWDTDYSSVEYRILGSMVGNKKIMENFKDPNFDYHAYQASRMFKIPYANIGSKQRKAAKGINFGLPYGMGDESLGATIFGEVTPENTRKAGGLRNAYFKGQEDIRDWFEFHRDKGVNLGYTETFFGRRRYYHKEKYSVGAIRRQAGNQVIQGTAADIYKTAVGRLFKRICKEGWLGKVLFSGFIHDELLGETSIDINPAQWLKVLREEFEVKITNDDGSEWCPLYMGFGWGMSWYEAKSVELPIEMQWELVDKYGVSGFDFWDGDGVKFCNRIPTMLRDFDVRNIEYQLLDADNQGKEIKLALNKQLLGCLKQDAKDYKKYMLEYNEAVDGDINDYLYRNCFISNVLVAEDGSYITEFDACSETQDAITQFCKLRGIDRDKINILDIPKETSNAGDTDFDSNSIVVDFEDDLSPEEKLQQIKDSRIDTLGMYVDVENSEVTLMVLPQNYMNFIKSKTNKDGKGYRVWFKDTLGMLNPEKIGGLYITEAYITSKDISVIQDLYIHYFNDAKKG